MNQKMQSKFQLQFNNVSIAEDDTDVILRLLCSLAMMEQKPTSSADNVSPIFYECDPKKP